VKKWKYPSIEGHIPQLRALIAGFPWLSIASVWLPLCVCVCVCSVYVLGCARPKSRENAHVYTYLPYCMCPGLDWLNTREQEILSNCSHFSSSIQIFTSNLSWMDRLEKKNFFFWCCHSFIHSRCKQTLAWGRTRGYAKSHLKNNSSQFARMAISNQPSLKRQISLLTENKSYFRLLLTSC